MSTPTPSLTSEHVDLLNSMSTSDLEEWLTKHPPETQAAIRQQLSQQATEPGSRPWVVASRGLVAEFFGVSTQTIKDWKSNGMPGSPGRWDLKEIRMWQDRRREQNVQAAGDQFAPVKGKILREDHRRKKLKNDELAGKLVLVADIRRAMVAWAVKLRSRIMAIPSEVAMLVPGEIKGVVTARGEDAVRVALKEAYESEIANSEVRALIISEAARLTSDDSNGDANSRDADE